jgi:hypothetical protein
MEMEEENNMEQTAMQEHIQWLKDTLEISKEQAPILCNCINLCISDAESRLQKEKEQKKKFFKVGFSQGFASDVISYHKLDNEKEKLFEQYYNETFKSE